MKTNWEKVKKGLISKQFQIPKSWGIVLLTDLAFFQEGPGVRKWQFRSEGVKLLNVGNINNGKINLDTTDLYISNEEAYGKYKHFLVNEGDLIIGSSGIIVDNFHNKIAYAGKKHLPLCMNTSTIRFKTLNPNVLHLNYLRYFLSTLIFKDQLRRLITGSAQLNFGPSHLKQIQIPLPPLPIQKKIADALDKADEIKRKRVDIIDRTRSLIRSRFKDLFGDLYSNAKNWEFVKFGNVIKVLTDYHANGSYKILKEHVELLDHEDYALMIRTTDLENGTYSGDNKYITKEAYEFLEKSKVFGGEIIINKIGSAGNVYLMPCLNRPVSLGMNAFMLRFHEQVEPIFIYYILTSSYGEKEIQKRVKGAVTKTIRKDAIRDIDIPLPPIKLQKQFVMEVKEIQQNVDLQSNQHEKSEELFSSLMQKAFKGELEFK